MTSTIGAPIEPKPMTPTGKSVSNAGGGRLQRALTLLRFESWKFAEVPQRHQCDVLRHARALLRIDCTHNRHVRRQVRRREQIIGARSSACDETQRREARCDTRRQPKREDGFDLIGRSRRRIGIDPLVGRGGAQCSELPFDERGRRQHENGHGKSSALERVRGEMVT